MNRKLIDQFIKKNYPDEADKILLVDGFEDAFLGIGCSCGGKNLAIYDRAECIRSLAKIMSHKEAEEYFLFNCEDRRVSDYTPIFLSMLKTKKR